MIAACAARALLLLLRSGYASDDMVNLSYARASSLDGTYLARSVFGEFEPGLRLVNWLVARTTPVERWPAVVIEIVAFVVVLALLAAVIGRLSGPTWWTPLLVGLVGWSVVATATVVWWSSALTYIVASVFGLLAVRAILDHAVHAGRRTAVVAVVALTACVSLYPGAAVFPLAAAMLCAFVGADGPRLRDAVASVARLWRLWSVLAVPLVAAYAVSALGEQYGTGAVAAPRQLASYLWTSWSETIAPSLVGLPPQFLSHRVVGEEVVLVVVAASVVACRRAWRAWVCFAVPTVAVLGAHGVARLANLGPAIAYIRSDLLPIELLAAMVVPLAFARTAGPFVRVGPEPRAWWVRLSTARPRPVALGRVVLAAVVVGTTVVLVGVGSPTITEVAQTTLARGYVDGFTRSWAALHARHPGAEVVDVIPPYPASISTEPDTLFPFDSASRVLGMFAPGAHFTLHTGRLDGAVAVSFPSGTVRPARLVPGPAVGLRAVATRGPVVTGTTARGWCAAAGAAPAVVALPVAPEGLAQLLALGARVSFQPVLDIDVGTVAGPPVTLAAAGRLHSGEQRIGLATVAPVRALVLTLPARAAICLTSASLAFVATAG